MSKLCKIVAYFEVTSSRTFLIKKTKTVQKKNVHNILETKQNHITGHVSTNTET